MWTFKRNGLVIPVATCGPTTCTVHQLDHFAVERSPSHSTLFYQQYDRQVDKGATLTCESHVGKSKKFKTCNLNVINGPDAGNVEIENCNAGFIDIRENSNNTIKCTGLNGRDAIAWSFRRGDDELPRTVATCGPSSQCTVHQLDHFAVERSPSHSTLFYQQYDRQVDKDTPVTCRSQFGTSNRSMACKVNVINPAELSSCNVQEDRDSRTVRGSCRFDHAYSYGRSFHCTWYQAKVGQPPISFPGNITYTSGSQDSSGVCTFSSTVTTWEPGTYTYSINFDPGPGNNTVNVGKITESSFTKEKTSSSIAAIVGGCVGGAVVIIVAVVIVVVKIKLRDKTYAIPTRRPRNAEPEHVYNDLQSNTTTTTTTTTPSDSIATTTGDLHNTTTNQHPGQGKNLDNVHHNPVYVNEN